ncbi:MAG: hypothetical protein PVI94_21215 [Desulfobacterales bacterium]
MSGVIFCFRTPFALSHKQIVSFKNLYEEASRTMFQLKDDQIVQVILMQLQERYAAAHKMRERSTKFTIGLSGMAIGLAWLLMSHQTLAFSQRIDTDDRHEASKTWRIQFGDRFPAVKKENNSIQKKEATAKLATIYAAKNPSKPWGYR